jgi:hypothetical protein
MRELERATGFEPATSGLEGQRKTSFASPAQAAGLFRRSNVRSLWQFAQTISHLAASASMRSMLPLIIRVTFLTFVEGSR